MPPKHPGAYVRITQPSELPALARVLTRALAKDPAMNWYGCVTSLVKDIENPTPPEAKILRNLRRFQASICKATLLEGGIITVVAIPWEDKDNGADQPTYFPNTLLNAGDDSGTEEIIAVSLWFPPGKNLRMGPLTLLRCGILDVIRGWGITGVKVGTNAPSRFESHISLLLENFAGLFTYSEMLSRGCL